MNTINKDTRPCPNCGTMIHKIDGCSQMWCTSCSTAFDWRTGKLSTGRIHNPHFFEFQKRSREHADIPCGGRPTISELGDKNAPYEIIDIAVILHKLDTDILYKYSNVPDEDNNYLRISYLLKNIDEHEFKSEIQKRDKQRDKLNDIRDILKYDRNSNQPHTMPDEQREQVSVTNALEKLISQQNSRQNQRRHYDRGIHTIPEEQIEEFSMPNSQENPNSQQNSFQNQRRHDDRMVLLFVCLRFCHIASLPLVKDENSVAKFWFYG